MNTISKWRGTGLAVILIAILVGRAPAEASQWTAVPLLGALEETKGQRLVGITVFDGRLYLDLRDASEKPMPAGKPKKKAEPEPAMGRIVSYDAKSDKLSDEYKAAGVVFGRLRMIGGKLIIPEAVAAAGGAGYMASSGGGKWERIPLGSNVVGVSDAIGFDGKLFFAGRDAQGAAIAWKPEAAPDWKIEPLTAQAARWSPQAIRFLAAGGFLFVLAERVPEKGIGLALQEWGPLYLLRYHPQGSERGFMFDGPPCPTSALRLMAGGNTTLLESGTTLGADVPCEGGVVYPLLPSMSTRVESDQYGLFKAVVEKALAWEGETLAARPLEGLKSARAVALEGGVYYVLLSEGVEGHARVLSSRDLAAWTPVFEGALPEPAAALAILNGVIYIGLWNGQLGKVE